jgi:hypothetical protein
MPTLIRLSPVQQVTFSRKKRFFGREELPKLGRGICIYDFDWLHSFLKFNPADLSSPITRTLKWKAELVP